MRQYVLFPREHTVHSINKRDDLVLFKTRKCISYHPLSLLNTRYHILSTLVTGLEMKKFEAQTDMRQYVLFPREHTVHSINKRDHLLFFKNRKCISYHSLSLLITHCHILSTLVTGLEMKKLEILTDMR